MHESVAKVQRGQVNGTATVVVLGVIACLVVATVACCTSPATAPLQPPTLLGRSFSLNGKTWTIINRRCGPYNYQVAAIDDHEGNTIWFDEPAAAKLVDLREHPAAVEPAPGGKQ